MGFRFRKSFKIAPGIRVNLGKSGITSVSVGKRGASLNIGKKGVYANIGLKGTGLSYRTKLTKQTNKMARASKINQLEKLDRMYKQGSLSEEEYAYLRNEILHGEQPRVIYQSVPQSEPVYQKNSGCLSVIGKVIKWGIYIFLTWALFAWLFSAFSAKETKPKEAKTQSPVGSVVETQPKQEANHQREPIAQQTPEPQSKPQKKESSTETREGYRPMTDKERKALDNLF